MRIDELSTETILAVLFPQLSDKEISIMTAQEDIIAAVANLKDVCGLAATQFEAIATKLHNHPATNGDAVLEGLVGDINTAATGLKNAAGDETAAEPGSVIGDVAQATTPAPQATVPAQAPVEAPSAGASDAASTGSVDTSASGAQDTGSTLELTPDQQVAGSPLPDPTSGASGAGSSDGSAPDAPAATQAG